MLLTALVSLLVTLALQVWRPFYHLTDDNLSAWLPEFVDFSTRLWSGHNPFVNEWIFGGSYDLRRDPGVLGFFGPFQLLCTPLGASRWYYFAPDIIASLNLITIAVAFCWSGLRLRELLSLKITNGALVWLSLSYAFSPFNLVVNPSWIGFINPLASMPVLIVAMHEPRMRRGLILAGAAMLYALVGSHLHPFIYMNLFLGLLALFLARQQRSWQPVLRLIGGGLIALVIVSPLLLSAFAGFATSSRNAGVSLFNATLSRLSPLQVGASVILGPAATPFLPEMTVHSADSSYGVAIAFSLVNVPLLLVLVRKHLWSLFEVGLAVMALVIVLLVMRPDWLQQALSHVPLIRSLRWPFREVADLLFVIHMLALLNFTSLMERSIRLWVAIGAASYAVIFLGGPPTFNAFHPDRSLLFSGKAEEHWKAMKARLGENPRIIVASHPALTYGRGFYYAPFMLMGAYNYGAFFHVVNVSGYSPTQAGSAGDAIHPYHIGGIYWYPHAQKIWRETPGLTLLEYLRNKPSLIRVRKGTDTFYIIYDEMTGETTLTSDENVIKALPPAPPLPDPRTMEPKAR